MLAPSNQFTVAHVRTHRDGTITFTVALPGPGALDVLETAWDDNLAHTATLLQPAANRFVYARKHVALTPPGAIRIRSGPTVAASGWCTTTPTGSCCACG